MGHKNGGTFEINGSKGSMRFNLERMNELEYLSSEDGDEEGFKTILVTNPTHPYMSAWWPPGHMIGWEHSHINQVYHLLDCIANDKMPEPSGGMRLVNAGAYITYTQSSEKIPTKVEGPEDLDPITRKPKEEEVDIWLVDICVPRRFIQDAIEDEEEMEEVPTPEEGEEAPEEGEGEDELGTELGGAEGTEGEEGGGPFEL